MNRFVPNPLLRLAVVAGLLLLSACDQTPTGRSQLTLVPEAVMRDMGQKTFARMKASQPVADEAASRKLVRCVAHEITAVAGQQYPGADLPEAWDIVVFNNDTPNAFALPGGNIGVHTGILRVAENPGQLAAIIGHEVGHLLADHGNERLTQQLGVKVGLLLVGMFGDIESEQLLQALGLGARLGITLPFSRAHEREADLMGLKLMATAGFRPEQSVALWRNMAKVGGGQPIELLSTHPANATRIETLRNHLDTANNLYRRARPDDCNA